LAVTALAVLRELKAAGGYASGSIGGGTSCGCSDKEAARVHERSDLPVIRYFIKYAHTFTEDTDDRHRVSDVRQADFAVESCGLFAE
jgi:hypothetical protein